MIVGFTGTRFGMSLQQKKHVSSWLSQNKNSITKVIHGGCIGADSQFHVFCLDLDLEIEVYPGKSKTSFKPVLYRGQFKDAKKVHVEKPYLERNRLIVDNSDVMLATPLNEIQKGGTWYTILYARDSDKHLIKFKR